MDAALIEQLINKINDPEVKTDERNEALEILYHWGEQQNCLEVALQFIIEYKKHSTNVVITSLMLTKSKVQDSWRYFTQDMVQSFVSILFQFLEENKAKRDDIAYRYALLNLIDVSILSDDPNLSMPTFMENNFPQDFYLDFLILYLEENASPFTKKYLENMTPSRLMLLEVCPRVLYEQPTSLQWLKVFQLLLQYMDNFEGYDWVFERFYQTFNNFNQIKIVIDIIVLCFSYNNDRDPEFYFQLYELFIRLSQHLRGDIEDDDVCSQLMLLWGGVLQAETNFLQTQEFYEILSAMLEEFALFLESAPLDNECWPKLLFNLSRFIQAFTDEHFNKDVLEFIFVEVIKLLDRDLPPIEDMSAVLKEIWNAKPSTDDNSQAKEDESSQIMRESLNSALNQMLNNPTNGLFSAVAHLWKAMKDDDTSLQYKNQLGNLSCTALLQLDEYPPSTLFFIQRVGRKFPEYAEQFFKIIIDNFDSDEDFYSHKVLFKHIIRNLDNPPEIEQSVFSYLTEKKCDPFEIYEGDSTKIDFYPLASIISLLSLYQSDDVGTGVHSIIIEAIQKAVDTDSPKNFIEVMAILYEIAKNLRKIKVNEWFKSFLMQIIEDARAIIGKNFYDQSEILQTLYVELIRAITVFLDISQLAAQYLDNVIRSNSFYPFHLCLTPIIQRYLPIESLSQLIASINPNDSEGQKAAYEFALILKDHPILWFSTPPELILEMLTANYSERATQDTPYYVAIAIDKRIQMTPPIDPDFLRAAIVSLCVGLYNIYQDVNLSKMASFLQIICKAIGIEEARNIMINAFGNNLNIQIQKFIEAVCSDQKIDYTILYEAFQKSSDM
ncbi:hypothetical protein TVAG_266700 [Trichomonas vaginalis G3]|uniref:Uncharacterized protein n=1 Tax=Trichomonas vaginalis (strain ATCC PRA-98 / G3) TaxID=412133 RepID=A2DQM3_TRIV3|nr:armadillo (ARM) repeat-containing protein family [Trichomonas vaginalis G3]EAY17307.1 hypothetical protein TVAG_266700 [Trichomonas vaginalis G3]KAI5523308.1 armadillo (ARM) repeat-containing protein family [Trichomonas vaginalis G3]|eukprot:XP_001329530.1 hypothetical protein [Trichomonas vaginalis G3]